MTTTKFKYREELENVLAKYGIKKEDICLVGSMALSIKGIREHGDIDFCAFGETRQFLKNQLTNGNYLSENVNLVVGKYERLLGIKDDELVKNDNYHDIFDGFKVIKLEIEFSAKLIRGWPKDLFDIPNIERHIINTVNWEWDLVCIENVNSIKNQNKKEKKVIRYLKKSRYLVKAIKNPSLIVPGVKYRIRKRYPSSKKINPVPSVKSQLVIKQPTAALLGNQFIDNEFSRYDVLLRYLIVKSISEGNNDYLLYYRMMQNARVGRDTEPNIVSLVNSIKERGFLDRYPIPITADGILIDGAHRLACALYFDLKEVPVIFEKHPKSIYYGRKWFEDIGFDDKILSLLDETKDLLFKEKGIWFSVILWPPAKPWFVEIENWLSTKYNIKLKHDVYLGSDFSDFTRKIYAIDDIDKWKVERKIHAMSKYKPEARVFAVEIPSPNFREKTRTKAYLSDEGAKIKAYIRNNYKEKVQGYVYDIICHTGDNHEHNSEIFSIIDEFL